MSRSNKIKDRKRSSKPVPFNFCLAVIQVLFAMPPLKIFQPIRNLNKVTNKKQTTSLSKRLSRTKHVEDETIQKIMTIYSFDLLVLLIVNELLTTFDGSSNLQLFAGYVTVLGRYMVLLTSVSLYHSTSVPNIALGKSVLLRLLLVQLLCTGFSFVIYIKYLVRYSYHEYVLICFESASIILAFLLAHQSKFRVPSEAGICYGVQVLLVKSIWTFLIWKHIICRIDYVQALMREDHGLIRIFLPELIGISFALSFPLIYSFVHSKQLGCKIRIDEEVFRVTLKVLEKLVVLIYDCLHPLFRFLQWFDDLFSLEGLTLGNGIGQPKTLVSQWKEKYFVDIDMNDQTDPQLLNNLSTHLQCENVLGITYESDFGHDAMLIVPNQTLSVQAISFIFENVKATRGLLLILQKLGVNGTNCLTMELGIPNLDSNKFTSLTHSSWLGLLKPEILPKFIHDHCRQESGTIRAGFLRRRFSMGKSGDEGHSAGRGSSHSGRQSSPFMKLNIKDRRLNEKLDTILNIDQNRRTDEVQMSDGSFYVVEPTEYIRLIVPAKTMLLLSDAEVKLALQTGLNVGLQIGVFSEARIALSRGVEYDVSQEFRTAHQMPIMNLAHLNELEKATNDNMKPEIDERYRNLSGALFRKGYKVTSENTCFYQLFCNKHECDLREFTTWFGDHAVKADRLNFRTYHMYKLRDLCEIDIIMMNHFTHEEENGPQDIVLTAMESSAEYRMLVMIENANKLHCKRMIEAHGKELQSQQIQIEEKMGYFAGKER